MAITQRWTNSSNMPLPNGRINKKNFEREYYIEDFEVEWGDNLKEKCEEDEVCIALAQIYYGLQIPIWEEAAKLLAYWGVPLCDVSMTFILISSRCKILQEVYQRNFGFEEMKILLKPRFTKYSGKVSMSPLFRDLSRRFIGLPHSYKGWDLIVLKLKGRWNKSDYAVPNNSLENYPAQADYIEDEEALENLKFFFNKNAKLIDLSYPDAIVFEIRDEEKRAKKLSDRLHQRQESEIVLKPVNTEAEDLVEDMSIEELMTYSSGMKRKSSYCTKNRVLKKKKKGCMTKFTIAAGSDAEDELPLSQLVRKKPTTGGKKKEVVFETVEEDQQVEKEAVNITTGCGENNTMEETVILTDHTVMEEQIVMEKELSDNIEALILEEEIEVEAEKEIGVEAEEDIIELSEEIEILNVINVAEKNIPAKNLPGKGVSLTLNKGESSVKNTPPAAATICSSKQLEERISKRLKKCCELYERYLRTKGPEELEEDTRVQLLKELEASEKRIAELETENEALKNDNLGQTAQPEETDESREDLIKTVMSSVVLRNENILVREEFKQNETTLLQLHTSLETASSVSEDNWKIMEDLDWELETIKEMEGSSRTDLTAMKDKLTLLEQQVKEEKEHSAIIVSDYHRLFDLYVQKTKKLPSGVDMPSSMY